MTPRARTISVWVVLLAGVGALVFFVWGDGCGGLSSEAVDTFAHTYSCPKDRITYRERDDILPSQIFVDPEPTPATPPDEVAADPGRLAQWRRDQAAARQQLIDSYDDRFNYSITVFEVAGCGHTVFMGCESTMYVGEYDCDEGHPPGTSGQTGSDTQGDPLSNGSP